jgi:hypothetical protein
MTQALAFVLCVLASKAVLDVWFKGSIFSWHRAWAELLRDEGKWKLSRLFGELMTCRFCFSYHTSLWMSLFCLPVLPWWALVPWWLAVRTTTYFVDSLEEALDERKNTSGNNDGEIPDNSGGGLFD